MVSDVNVTDGPYNAVVNHATYRPDLYRTLIPNAVEFSVLRNPIDHWLSWWMYDGKRLRHSFGRDMVELLEAADVEQVRLALEFADILPP
jgi:hypothetical protein